MWKQKIIFTYLDNTNNKYKKGFYNCELCEHEKNCGWIIESSCHLLASEGTFFFEKEHVQLKRLKGRF